ncbi:hypothetical protein O6H91_01G068800 [Diphasiastrum complanatum]|uniref:Uncharacterized protein n=1 Tax=Diphasiastrum complanatum TaxID=34168 RepID=A0ACC2ES07_DIPCM|nr:hypothetical protein O6H91_01G068800 [Diphasiastrum complanatum]
MATEEINKVGIYRSNSEGNMTSVASESAFDIPWASGIATEQSKCECCGLQEECTAVYIQWVRELHCGQFVCGLCAEAVNEELTRKRRERTMTMEEALRSHMTMCTQFNSPERTDPTTQLVTAVVAMRKILLRRMIGSPDAPKPKAFSRSHSRSTSCIPLIGHNHGFSSTG